MKPSADVRSRSPGVEPGEDADLVHHQERDRFPGLAHANRRWKTDAGGHLVEPGQMVPGWFVGNQDEPGIRPMDVEPREGSE